MSKKFLVPVSVAIAALAANNTRATRIWQTAQAIP